MILLNGNQVDFTQFPDGTTSFRIRTTSLLSKITWRYDGDHECILLWYLVKHLRAGHGRLGTTELFLPYIPNARMDRVKAPDEVFTLKWFAEFINSLSFDKVTVLDPHSNVATALINNVHVVQPDGLIRKVVEAIGDNLLFCYPDEGAAKRYSELLNADYVFGIKHRDWRTGKIERLELTTPEKVAGRNVLIVDDICSRGGTFTYTARALKNAGANDIYLYVSHCENTIFDGSVLTDGLIRRVFTTDSIYRGHHDRVEVV